MFPAGKVLIVVQSTDKMHKLSAVEMFGRFNVDTTQRVSCSALIRQSRLKFCSTKPLWMAKNLQKPQRFSPYGPLRSIWYAQVCVASPLLLASYTGLGRKGQHEKALGCLCEDTEKALVMWVEKSMGLRAIETEG